MHIPNTNDKWNSYSPPWRYVCTIKGDPAAKRHLTQSMDLDSHPHDMRRLRSTYDDQTNSAHIKRPAGIQPSQQYHRESSNEMKHQVHTHMYWNQPASDDEYTDKLNSRHHAESAILTLNFDIWMCTLAYI